MSAHRPRKRFGQNFLHDAGTITRIVDAINPQPGDSLLEIGPGQGALTLPVLERAGHLHAIEIDRDLIEPLHRTSAAYGKLTIHNVDALSMSLADTGLKAPICVFGNLPYNISTPLLFHLLKQRDAIGNMVFMLQREVVDRLAATPGAKSYGRLSLAVQYHCEVRSLMRVRPGAFNPPPKVESAVVRLKPRASAPFEIGSEAAYERILRAAFAHRRKTLQNNLKGLLDPAQITEVGIDPKRRAETLTPEEFGLLSRLITRSTQ